jgi:protein involved in polysaccharide export with SLBB domain
MYGQVYVAGLTLAEAKVAIEKHLARFLDNPQVAVTVFAYNSKVYYVIFESPANGDSVTRLPITGSETVLDAISHVSGLSGLSRKRIWIARPQPGGERHDKVLPVNWQDITRGASTATNYQVLPGDRIFVVEKPSPQAARY